MASTNLGCHLTFILQIYKSRATPYSSAWDDSMSNIDAIKQAPGGVNHSPAATTLIGHRPNPWFNVLAAVVIVAGIIFILSVVFFSGAIIFGHNHCHHHHHGMFRPDGPWGPGGPGGPPMGYGPWQPGFPGGPGGPPPFPGGPGGPGGPIVGPAGPGGPGQLPTTVAPSPSSPSPRP